MVFNLEYLTILQRVFKFKIIKITKTEKSLKIEYIVNKKKSYLVGWSKNHKIDLIKYENCKNFTRKMPKKFIQKNKFDVSADYLKYLDKVLK